jgi:hypothetical protein
MFQSDELIYIQMQKTGCTHIASLFSKLFIGEQIGKHNAATDDQLASCRYFISSIRNPWDWYLSLWTYGVQGNGGIRHRLIKRHVWRAVKTAAESPRKACVSALHELSKSARSWRKVYDRSDNVASFRQWLKRIHDPRHSHSLGEGYGFTSVPRLGGFMTYRYLRLCCRNLEELSRGKSIVRPADLARFEKDNCYIDFFIRQESLEDDFCKAIEKVRPLSAEEKEFVYRAKKLNASQRSLTFSDYYDCESLELVSRREELLIKKFNYAPPAIA